MKGELANPERWVDEHGDALFRYALMRLRDKQLAEEAVQETFLAALQARKSFAGHSSEKTWLIGILKHKVIDHFRRTKKEVSLDETDLLPTETEETFRTTGEWIGHWSVKAAPIQWGGDPVRMLEQRDFRKAFQDCLNSLPERLARVFTLREIDELSAPEICKLLDISESNLWVMLHRARMQLRRALELRYFRAKQLV